MSVLLKRAEGVIPNECHYGCCTELYGKNVPKYRRTAKRRSRQEFRREVRDRTY